MATFEVTLSDQTESEIDRLVEGEDFLNREQAIEELLSRGVSAYDTTDSSTDDVDDEIFRQVANDQEDPAKRDEHESERDSRSF
ncbi:MAG: CopG family transcriptional regulator [Haloferacaceae archaeon]